MANVYEAEMVQRIRFNIKADNEDDAYDWIQTHTIEDVKGLTTYFDQEYDDKVIGIAEDDDFCGIHINNE